MTPEKFPHFAQLVTAGFQDVAAKPHAFVTDGDQLFRTYLAAFPTGTDPIFRTRTEHDCVCCRQFIRRIGGVVALKGATVQTIWDKAAVEAPYPYNVVACALRDAVRCAVILDVFRVARTEATLGSAFTRTLAACGAVITWPHFSTGEIPGAFRDAAPARTRGAYRTSVAVLARGLEELTADAVDAESNSI
jgi:hypothetical protein